MQQQQQLQKEDSKKEINLVCETGLGFSQRDKNVKSQEDKGLLDFYRLF